MNRTIAKIAEKKTCALIVPRQEDAIDVVNLCVSLVYIKNSLAVVRSYVVSTIHQMGTAPASTPKRLLNVVTRDATFERKTMVVVLVLSSTKRMWRIRQSPKTSLRSKLLGVDLRVRVLSRHCNQ